MTKPANNDSPDPNIGRVIKRPGPDRAPAIPDEPDKPGMGQGGQPPHQEPGQHPRDPVVEQT